MLLRSRRLFSIVLLINACANLVYTKLQAQDVTDNKALHQLFDNYYEEYLKLKPLDATYRGDDRYNDLLPNDGAADYLKAQHDFLIKYQNALKKFNFQKLDEQDKISYGILMFAVDRELE